MKHKKQHFVPASYLSAWCDPDAPTGHEPYVWVFERDSRQGRPRAPANIFFEANFYTKIGQQGERDLSLENALNRLETDFAKIRREKLDKRLPLSRREGFLLCAFCAAMHGRTRAQRENTREQWRDILEAMNGLTEWAKGASPDELKNLSRFPSSGDEGESLSQEDVQQIVNYPAQTTLPLFIQIETPILCQMSLAVLYTEDDLGFITSDHPCLWFDPRNRFPGLASRSIEVSLPLSPRQILLLNWKNLSGYIPVSINSVDKANSMLRNACEREYIVRRNEVRPAWFIIGRLAQGGPASQSPNTIAPADA